MNPKKENLKFLAFTIFICFFMVSCSCESPTTPTNEQMFYDTTTTLTFDFTPVSNFEAVDFVRGVSTNLPLGAGESITRLVSSNVVTNFVTNTTNVSRVFVYITNINAVSNNFRDTDNLAGVDLSGYALAGVDFSTYDLTGAVLIGTDLSNANLSNANFSNANFSNADVRRATIIDINLVGATNTEHASWGLEFDISSDNISAVGLWSDGTTMWVSHDTRVGDQESIFAYELATGQRVSNQDFNNINLDLGAVLLQGIWSDGITMWISTTAGGVEGVLYAYRLADKTRDMDKDFSNVTSNMAGSTSLNGVPGGIWSDSITMWVSDNSFDKIDANSFSNKERTLEKDINTPDNVGNDSPAGIWSDGVTMWVVDSVDNKIYAYDLVSKERVPDREFNNLANDNDSVIGIWSDGTTLWVSDVSDFTENKLFAYNLRAKVRTP